MKDFFTKLQESGFEVGEIRQDEEMGYYEFVVTETRNGGQRCEVNWQFLSSPELRQLIGMSRDFLSLRRARCATGPDGEKKTYEDPKELLDRLLERAKKGLVIQRYKGLGEMNPDQLWNTTMNPEKRTLLKVEIEDAVEADEMFNILMGDKVEPRREFIQSNALEVTELDI